MSNFQSTYLDLLRRQVDEEISYLVRNGHDADKIHVNCMFCTEHRQGHYTCYRLTELRRFQSSIVQNFRAQNRLPALPKSRRLIGTQQDYVVPELKSESTLEPILNLQF